MQDSGSFDLIVPSRVALHQIALQSLDANPQYHVFVAAHYMVVVVRIEEKGWRCACVGNQMPRLQARVVMERHVRKVVGSLVGTLEVGFRLERLGSRILGDQHLDLEKI